MAVYKGVVAGFVSEYCPACGVGHLNQSGQGEVKCSLCETVFEVKGDVLVHA